MSLDRYGFVDSLAADRPLVVTLLLSFGLTTLAVAGSANPETGFVTPSKSADLLVSVLAHSTAPLILAAIAPQTIILRLMLVGAALGLLVAFAIAAPLSDFQPIRYSLGAGAAIVTLTTGLVMVGPAFGAMIRFSFIAPISAALGMAGALGFMAMERVDDSAIAGLLATLAFSLGAAVGLGAASDFSLLFARGADARTAAGVAARYGAAPALYGVVLAAAASGVIGFDAGAAENALRLAWIGGAAALFAAIAALFSTAAALALRGSSELVAIRENRRREAFRRYWRPIRRALPSSSATAFVAIAGVVGVAAIFSMKSSIATENILFIAAVSLAACVVFLSLHAGMFILISVLGGFVLSTWIWEAAGGPTLSVANLAAGTAFSTALLAQLAGAWRDARNPRMNARETTEAAISDALSPYVLSTLVGMAAFLGAEAAGVWPGGADTAMRLGLNALMGLLLAPPLMTMLTSSARQGGR